MAKTKIQQPLTTIKKKELKELRFLEKWTRNWFHDWGHPKRDKKYQARLLGSVTRLTRMKRKAKRQKQKRK